MVDKKVRQKYYEECRDKAKKIAERLLQELWDRDYVKGSKVFRTAKVRVGNHEHVRDEDIQIPRKYLKEIAFTLRSPLQTWCLLKTREKFWGEYGEWKQFEYWHECPVPYRLGSDKEGIKVPEITEQIVHIEIIVHYWRAVAREQRRKWHKEGQISYKGKVSSSLRRELERWQRRLLEGENWRMGD